MKTEPETGTITINVWCGCFLIPEDEWGRGGVECDYNTTLEIPIHEWEDGYVMIECPDCHAELWSCDHHMEPAGIEPLLDLRKEKGK